MDMNIFTPSLVLISSLFLIQSSYQELSTKRSYEFKIINRVNQTGHFNLGFFLNQASPGFKRNWQVIVKHEVTQLGGIEKHSLEGHITGPPAKPTDYELFHGIGYYKFHNESAKYFDAMTTCAREGGHLAIINSQEEANVIMTLHARYPEVHSWAAVGFYDKDEKQNYVTIFGKPMAEIGYKKWFSPVPDHSYGKATCGVVNREGLIDVAWCMGARPFVCEYDLAWDY